MQTRFFNLRAETEVFMNERKRSEHELSGAESLRDLTSLVGKT
jgi:hypothetical protein